MRMMIAMTAAILLPFAAAAAATNQQRDVEECMALSQSDMRECLSRSAAKSQALLRRAETKASTALAKWDEDAKYTKLATAQLDVANKAFAEYRDAQCNFASSLGGGAIANALEMRQLACTITLNNERAALLSDSIGNLPRK